jgi:LmbE family N-acetylglucosaminyl deacetylase
MKKKVIVFAPHADDETLGCGGTIAKKVKEGYDVSVVFMTDGRHCLAEIGVSTGPVASEIKLIRKEEAIRATKILGLQEKNLCFLDFEDKTLEKNKSLVQKRVAEILTNASPVEVYFTQSKEYNIDHRVTNTIVRKAIEEADINPIQYHYIIAWKFPFYLLANLSQHSKFDWLLSKIQQENLIYVDISKFLHLKEMAIKEYKSQIELLSDEQKRPALKSSFLKRFLESKEKFFITSQKS